METSTPRVSICTQVLNQSVWLREMVASVVAQTFTNWELLIVDDGSTEDIKGVLESFNDNRIQYFRFDENRGIPFGINHVLPKARGEFICILAADETIERDKLRIQTEYLDKFKQVGCVWGLPGNGPLGLRPSYEQYALQAHNRSREAWLRTLINRENVPIGSASLMMRKSVLEDIGYMDETLTIFSDHELFCRFFEKHTGVILPYRWALDKPVNDTSVRTKSAEKANAEYEYVKAKHPIIEPPVTGKVTVCIPCYNHAKYLADCVNSVLAQTFTDLEILILDDASTDDFKTVVQQFTDPRIKVMAFDENRGQQEAVNQMAFRAEGEFCFVLSADDTIDPMAIEKCLAEFAKNPWLEFVATQNDFMLEDGSPVGKNPPDTVKALMAIPKAINRKREEWLGVLYNGNHYFGAGMYRTKVLSDLGGWKKEFKVISDYEMYLNLLQRENIRIVEEPLTHTRVHGENHSLLSPERAQELPTLYKNAKKTYYRPLIKVIIATPFYELKGFSPYITSLCATTRLLTNMGIDWRFMELSGDSYVHRARNTMCDVFLKDPDATDLFFIDSDMSWNPEAFVKMLLLPHPLLGGTYPVKNMWEAWTSIPKSHREGDQIHYKGVDLGDGSALIEADVLAGGFLRIKRHVLEMFRERYKDLWYKEPTTDLKNPEYQYTAFFAAQSEDHRFFGEDHMFSKRMREMGVQMFIYPNVDITHWGYKDFSGNYDKFLKAQKFTPVDPTKAVEAKPGAT